MDEVETMENETAGVEFQADETAESAGPGVPADDLDAQPAASADIPRFDPLSYSHLKCPGDPVTMCGVPVDYRIETAEPEFIRRVTCPRCLASYNSVPV